ncbi:twin-arginine translocase TatA/TatE family subunit [Psychromonas antarctica]|jgi:sec-independent protein translocase protein TatA|uniref:twin-arginine translocase TatA/TatE family subunit n=1 Tax=Psychromonas antarctica TaxID=67573 RepID=UPI001EE896AA|nr:twin-arginine translocase TatA/TatE family subunit [Psychromonas antarctica]MCG6201401.1 twin-arginine translocase TatA/TatE family subunit [Psychromonas antarctica]
MGGIGIWQLVIIAVIVVLLFGTKKLRGIGGDLGDAIKGFKKAMKEENKATPDAEHKPDEQSKIDPQSNDTKK